MNALLIAIRLWIIKNLFLRVHFTASAIRFSPNYPTNTSCVNWNQYYTNCTQLGGNPFQGTISFDNIGLAWVAIFLVSQPVLAVHQVYNKPALKTSNKFQVISLEGWSDIMYYVQDAHSFWDWIYFVLLIVVRFVHPTTTIPLPWTLILHCLVLLSIRSDRSSWSICVWLSLRRNSQRRRNGKWNECDRSGRASLRPLRWLPVQTTRSPPAAMLRSSST